MFQIAHLKGVVYNSITCN